MKRLMLGVMIVTSLAACGSTASRTEFASPTVASEMPSSSAVATVADESGNVETFSVQVWADNWFAFYVNGEKVAEDSVPITTERSFNAETFTFTASRPFVIGIVAKDFMENQSGLEYIGTDRQQMGDGGIVVQVFNDANELVATTDKTWKALVTQEAPLNVSCERSNDPLNECQYREAEDPTGWMTREFDDSTWQAATVHSADAVGPKGGYDEISWDPKAEFVWGPNLKTDNVVLLRRVVANG